MQYGGKIMKETKIVQAYPSDSAIDRAIKEWESFGWELTNNQRYQDKSSAYIPGYGTETTTTTYNKLTFSREKSSPWYPEVKRLEEEYEGVTGQISAIKSTKPVKKPLGLLDIVLVFIPFPFVGLIIYRIVLSSKFKKAMKKYEAESTQKLAELDSKAESIKRKARNIIENA